MFAVTKQVICHDKSMLAATKLLLRQNYVCCDKIFLSWQTRVCWDKIMFVVTKYFCHDKHVCVMTSILLLWQNIFLSQQTCATKLLWQNYVLRDKYLLRQKFCHDTKIILVAAPANNYTSGSSEPAEQECCIADHCLPTLNCCIFSTTQWLIQPYSSMHQFKIKVQGF